MYVKEAQEIVLRLIIHQYLIRVVNIKVTQNLQIAGIQDIQKDITIVFKKLEEVLEQQRVHLLKDMNMLLQV